MKTWMKYAAVLLCAGCLCGCGEPPQNVSSSVSETKAPAPETKAPAPETKAPATETKTPATETKAPTEPKAAVPTEKPEKETETVKEQYTDWKSAYSAAMDAFFHSNHYTEGQSGYALQDLNSDGTPEMILFWNAYEFDVYTYSNGQAIKLKDMDRLGEIAYSEKYQLVRVSYIMTYSHVNVWYRIKDGTAEEVASAVYIADDNPDPEVPTSYMVNREDVTQEEYDRVMEKYGGNDSSYQPCKMRTDFANAF